MVKLTPELIQNSYQRMNPVKDRELDLRGYKIPMIENLGATLNQFDTIDFSDNDIRKLDNFPLLPRLKTILMNNNRVIRISPTIEETLAGLETLILTNNMIAELGDIDVLANMSNLKQLSLLFNPVSTKEHYRLYVIYKLSQLKVLDFRKIKLKEREEAKQLFKSKIGKELRKEIAQNRSYLDKDDLEDGPGGSSGLSSSSRRVQSEADIQAIKQAISSAGSLEEIERLNQLLRTGQIPPQFDPRAAAATAAASASATMEEVEEDDKVPNGGGHSQMMETT